MYRIFYCFFFLAASTCIAEAQSLPHYSGSEVIVIDSNKQSSSAIAAATVRTDELKARSGSTQLSRGAAQLYPSLDIRNYGSIGGVSFATFRGLPAEFITVEYNGIPLNNAQHSLSDLGLIDLNILESVSFSSTSSNLASKGDAGNAMLNIYSTSVTSTGNPSAKVGYSFTSYADKFAMPEKTGYLKVSTLVSPFISLSAAASVTNSDGAYPFSQQKGIVHRANNDATLANYSIDLDFHPNVDLKYSLFTFYTKANRGLPGANTTEGAGNSSFARQFDEIYLLGIKGNYTNDSSTSYSIDGAFQSQFETYNDLTHSIADRYKNNNYSLEADRQDILDNFHFTTGISTDYNTLSSNENIRTDSTGISRVVLRLHEGIHYTFTNDFFAAGNIRVEQYNDIAQTQILPQLQVGYNWDEVRTRFSASYSLLYHAPTFNELYWKVGGNPQLKPEKGSGFEFSAKTQLVHGWNIQATGYLNEINNQIVWVPGAVWTPQNIQLAKSYGVELSTELQGEISEWLHGNIRGAIMLQHAVNKTPGSINYGNELIYSTPLRWNLSGTLAAKHIGELTASILYRGHRNTDYADNGKLPPVALTNIAFRTSPFKIISDLSVSLSASITNLLDVQYQEILNYPLPGREYRLGIDFIY